MPDHSTFSKNRHGRFRESDLLRHVFETVVGRCVAEGLVGGEGFAVDASLIRADASRQEGVEGAKDLPPELMSRAVEEYLAVLDDAAFGAATEVTPKFLSPADPAARWTAAQGGQAFFAYCANYLIDLDHAVIVDVEASTAVRQAEMTAAKTDDRADGMSASVSTPERLAADTAYGSAEMLDWLVHEHGIEPHVPVFDKLEAARRQLLARRLHLRCQSSDHYVCPGGKILKQYRRNFKKTKERRHQGQDADLPRQPDRTAKPAPSRSIAAPRHRPVRCRATSTRGLETSHERSPRPTPTPHPGASARRSRCSSPTSSASSASGACDYAAPPEPTTSSSSPPPPRTSENSQN